MLKQERNWERALQNEQSKLAENFWQKLQLKGDHFKKNYSFSIERGVKCLRCQKDCFIWKRMFNLIQHEKKCSGLKNMGLSQIDQVETTSPRKIAPFLIDPLKATDSMSIAPIKPFEALKTMFCETAVLAEPIKCKPESLEYCTQTPSYQFIPQSISLQTILKMEDGGKIEIEQTAVLVEPIKCKADFTLRYQLTSQTQSLSPQIILKMEEEMVKKIKGNIKIEQTAPQTILKMEDETVRKSKGNIEIELITEQIKYKAESPQTRLKMEDEGKIEIEQTAALVEPIKCKADCTQNHRYQSTSQTQSISPQIILRIEDESIKKGKGNIEIEQTAVLTEPIKYKAEALENCTQTPSYRLIPQSISPQTTLKMEDETVKKSKRKIEIEQYVQGKSFYTNDELLKIYEDAKSRFGNATQTKHTKTKLKKIIDFLEFCCQQNQRPNSSLIVSYVESLKLPEDRLSSNSFKGYSQATKIKITRFLNALLKPHERFKIVTPSTLPYIGIMERVRRSWVKAAPLSQEDKEGMPLCRSENILTMLKICDTELFEAVLLAKWIRPRICEIVKLQIKHFIQMEFPVRQWYVYYRSHTKRDKIEKVPEDVYNVISNGKSAEDFCIKWQRADTLSHHLLNVCRNNDIPYYSMDCWRERRIEESLQHDQQEKEDALVKEDLWIRGKTFRAMRKKGKTVDVIIILILNLDCLI